MRRAVLFLVLVGAAGCLFNSKIEDEPEGDDGGEPQPWDRVCRQRDIGSRCGGPGYCMSGLLCRGPKGGIGTCSTTASEHGCCGGDCGDGCDEGYSCLIDTSDANLYGACLTQAEIDETCCCQDKTGVFDCSAYPMDSCP